MKAKGGRAGDGAYVASESWRGGMVGLSADEATSAETRQLAARCEVLFFQWYRPHFVEPTATSHLLGSHALPAALWPRRRGSRGAARDDWLRRRGSRGGLPAAVGALQIA